MWAYVDAEGTERTAETSEIVTLVQSGTLNTDSLLRPVDGKLRYQRLTTIRELREAIALAASNGAEEERQYLPGEAITGEQQSACFTEWFYVDDGGCERGPLSTAQMCTLVKDGWLNGPRLIKQGAQGDPRDVSLWPELQEEAEAVLNSAAGAAVGPGDAAEVGDAAETGSTDWEMDGVEEEWVYIDDDGNLQGPFSTAEMRAWHEAGHLGAKRRVNVAGGDPADFRPISEWLELSAESVEGKADTDCAGSVDTIRAVPLPVPDQSSTEMGANSAKVAGQEEGASIKYEDGKLSSPVEASVEVSVLPQSAAASLHQVHSADSVDETANEPQERTWVYIDDNGMTQGPFSTQRLSGWLRKGLLGGSRLCRPSDAPADMWRAMESYPLLASALRVSNSMMASNSNGAARGVSSAAASGGADDTCPALGVSEAVHGTADAAAGIDHDASSTSTDHSLWEYIDDRGRVQGPFTARKLLDWLKAGHLKPTRRGRLYVPPPAEPPEQPASFADKFTGGVAHPSAPTNPHSFKRLDEWQWFATALGALECIAPCAYSAQCHLEREFPLQRYSAWALRS